MNIFPLDDNPSICAMYHQDTHVGKLFLEACQILCHAYPIPNNPDWINLTPKERVKLDLLPYARYGDSNPLVIWSKINISNWNWLLELAVALEKEHIHRFNKRHGTAIALEWIIKHKVYLSNGERTKFRQIMPDEYKSSNAIESYRLYYKKEKMFLKNKPAKWTNREIPFWIN